MKAKLLERLKMMDETIAKQNDVYQQAMAQLNALNGCKQELLHILNMCNEPVSEPQPIDPPLADMTGEVV